MYILRWWKKKMAEQLTLKVLKTTTDKKYLSKSINKIVEKNCRLKDGSSIVNPVVILKKLSDSHTRQFNYAYIREWGRYYFVNDIVEMPAEQIQIQVQQQQMQEQTHELIIVVKN